MFSDIWAPLLPCPQGSASWALSLPAHLPILACVCHFYNRSDCNRSTESRLILLFRPVDVKGAGSWAHCSSCCRDSPPRPCWRGAPPRAPPGTRGGRGASGGWRSCSRALGGVSAPGLVPRGREARGFSRGGSGSTRRRGPAAFPRLAFAPLLALPLHLLFLSFLFSNGVAARGAVLNSWKGPGCTEDALQSHERRR